MDTVYRRLVGYVLLAVIVLGITGCILSLVVWTKGRQRRSATAKFLSALAAVDLLVLSGPAAEYWVYMVWDYTVKDQSRALCKALVFLVYALQSLSSWILVCVTVERAVGVWRPHTVKLLCSPRTARLAIGTTVLLIVCVYLPAAFSSELIQVPIGELYVRVCLITVNMDHYIAFLWLDMTTLFIAPFALLLFSNAAILAKIIWRHRSRANQLQQVTMRRKSRGKRHNIVGVVTARIIALNLTFCLCTGPITIHDLWLMLDGGVATDGDETRRYVFQLLVFVGNSVNFLLYCVLGSSFRRDLHHLLTSRRRRSRRVSALSTTSDTVSDYRKSYRQSLDCSRVLQQ